MTKRDKLKAFKEAIKRAKDTLAYYEKKSLEELEEMDTSELCCLGGDFNWLPNSGYDYDQEQQQEAVEWLCECADHRAKQTQRYYLVSFFEEGEKVAKARFGVSFMGLQDKGKALAQVIASYPQYKDLRAKVETLSKAEYIANF